MRIQHNVTALNAYRNLRGNNLNLAKNLEKLSSGYRINRAGDDAAGLAVSEKMRAQITGLDAATKNAQDGISLVQTAEGALTEVHSMLNRMVTLATQSANGTYDNEVDRANLQKEVASLKTEIDRISESSNYNGIKLLDGSLSKGASNAGLPNVTVNGVTGDAGAAAADEQVITIKSNKNYKFEGEFLTKGTFNAAINKFTAVGDTAKAQIKFNDDSGKERVIDIELVAGNADGTLDTAKSVVKLDDKVIDINKALKNVGKIDGNAGQENATTAISKILNNIEDFSSLFEVKSTQNTGADGDGSNSVNIHIKAKNAGTEAEVKSILTNASLTTNLNELKDVKLILKSKKEEDSIIVKGDKIFAISKGHVTDEDIKEALIEVNGEKFIFVNDADKNEQDVIDAINKMGIAKDHIVYSSTGTTGQEPDMKAADVTNMASTINEALSKEVAYADGTNLIFKGKNNPGNGKGLTLQIGDTSDKFNKMNVSVDSMSSKGLGIVGVDVGTQEQASKSMDKIKNAINIVSSTRGDLGALQNRLEHTINNLGVMHENITEAESRIRDTDMAKEMMAYAKNNILVQSSTAMLAQANQLPQSVLQLLQ